MSDLTPAELAELRRLHEAATPDPWTWSQPGERVVMRVGTADYMDATHQPDSHGPANISLAVAARNALPRLLAEIERLRAELECLRGPDIRSALSRLAANMKARDEQESINEMQMRLYHEQSKGVE